MTTQPITAFADLRLPPTLYQAWNLGRDANEAHLPVDADPFPWSEPEYFLAWLLGYLGAPVSLAGPFPTQRGRP